jgi:putative membrane protein
MNRLLASVVTAAAAIVPQLPGAAMAQGIPPTEVYPYGPYMMWGSQGAFLGPVFMVAIIVGVIALVAVLLRRPSGQPLPFSAGRAPLDILKERFARGEIDKAEYDDRRRVLGRIGEKTRPYRPEVALAA